MKKLLPIFAVVLVVILVAVAWFFLGKGKKGVSLPVPGEIKKEAGEKGETFTGKLKDAIAKGLPMKCTYSQGGNSVTSYLKGSRVYGEISGQGKEGYLIMVDKCLWTWNKGESQGLKMCFEKNVWEEGEGTTSVPTEGDYICAPALVSDSQFNPPGNVNFLSLEEMMKGQ